MSFGPIAFNVLTRVAEGWLTPNPTVKAIEVLHFGYKTFTEFRLLPIRPSWPEVPGLSCFRRTGRAIHPVQPLAAVRLNPCPELPAVAHALPVLPCGQLPCHAQIPAASIRFRGRPSTFLPTLFRQTGNHTHRSTYARLKSS